MLSNTAELSRLKGLLFLFQIISLQVVLPCSHSLVMKDVWVAKVLAWKTLLSPDQT